MKSWDGRFTTPTAKKVEEFTASITFDYRLWQVDIMGSIAYTKALEKSKLLTSDEAELMISGLNLVAEKIAKGNVEFKVENEDIHMNIENLLFEEIGELAGKLHTGRRRNDQVALDIRLYLRNEIMVTIENISHLQAALIQIAKQHIDTLLPGYTHLQRAQPIRFAHHLLAYVAMLQRDADRLIDGWPRLNTLPLGAGALAGSGFDIDREYLANLLYFEHVSLNSMDTVSDRDFIAEFIFNASMIMLHLSRFCEEVILWSTQEFAFVEIDDAYCTGSSMMPQKKNPDVAELIRGKSGRVYGALINILTMLKSLPLTYSKDMQEDKEALFDAIYTVNSSLALFTSMLKTMKINTENMLLAVSNDFSAATAMANYLVHKGVPFRSAHKIVGSIIAACLKAGVLLNDLSIQRLKSFSAHFDADIYQLLQPENIVELYRVTGGTGKNALLKQISLVEERLAKMLEWRSTLNF